MASLHPAAARFVRFSSISLVTFGFDLLLLAGFTQLLGIPYYVSTPLALLIAITVNYAFTRRHVFAGTARSIGAAYVNYLLIAALGAVVITGAVYLLVTYLHVYYLLARVVVGAFTGIGNYLLNLLWNFRVAGKHAPLSTPEA